MKLAVMRALTWLALKGRLYSFWSKLYQFMFEHRHVDKQLPLFSSFAEVKKLVGAMQWRRDTWLMLWDAISHPAATYSRHQAGKPAGDCDDISFVAVHAIKAMMGCGVVEGIIDVGLLSVPWMDKEGKLGGHNVCVFQYYQSKSSSRSKWAHVSNWHGGEIVSGLDSLEDVVRNVLAGSESLGWAMWGSDLKLRRYGSGKSVRR